MLPMSRSLFDHEAMSLLTVSVAAVLLAATILVLAALTSVRSAKLSVSAENYERGAAQRVVVSIAFFNPSRS